MKIYCINLDRSTDRLESVTNAFPNDALVRVKGVDGLQWSDEFDIGRRPAWDLASKSRLEHVGALHPGSGKSMYPTSLGCSLGHLSAWTKFLETTDHAAIFIEDDIQPVGFFEGDSLAKRTDEIFDGYGCDALYLCSPYHPGQRIRVYGDDQIKSCRTGMGYVFTRRAAELAIHAAFPAFQCHDIQVSFRIFKSMDRPAVIRSIPPGLKRLERIIAKCVKIGLVEHSEHARISTMTRDGLKPWLPVDMIC